MENLTLLNARLPGQQGLYQLEIQGGVILEITPMRELTPVADEANLDLEGDWLSLGGIDLQINGGLGLAFPDLEKTHLPTLDKICKYLWEQGIDGFLPTLVTTSGDKFRQSLEVIQDYLQQSRQENQAQILGVHLEGPFLNRDKRGAHPQEYLQSLTLDNVKRLIEGYEDIIKIITLAPELDPTGDTIAYLHSLGITISLGHSLATETQAKQAFQQGASMVTHAFNAMPGLHHRQPGLLGAALTTEGVYCGAIADGQHITPTMLQLLLRAGNFNQGIFLVSDALAPIGLPDGIYPWDTRQIEVTNGTARLPDGTLAGTTLPLLTGAQNLTQWGLCDPETAILLATDSPRQAINLPTLSPGETASFLRWHWDENSQQLSVKGRI
jgi:N-acetylglucosamine-6-phosphate deacetylase